MKKKIVYGLLLLPVVFVLLLTAAVGWLFRTEEGARWFISFISDRSGVEITSRKLQGSLSGGLEMERLLVAAPDLRISVGRIQLQFDPVALLSRTVSLENLSIDEMHIQDDRPKKPKKPADLTWPAITGLPAVFQARGPVEVRDFLYRRLADNPIRVQTLSAMFRWEDAKLSLENLTFRLASLKAKGKISAGFRLPSLDLDLLVQGKELAGKINRISLRAALSPAPAPFQLDGPVTVSGMSDSVPGIALSSHVGMTKNSIRFREILLFRPERKGRISGDAEILFKQAGMEYRMNILVNDLNLSPELPVETDLSGMMKISGDVTAYRGNFTFRNRGKNWREINGEGDFSGNRTSVRMAIRNGGMLGGSVAGTLEADWDNLLILGGKIRGKGLNPAVVHKKWDGAINVNVEAKVSLGGKQPEGAVQATLLESRLHDKELRGELNAGFRGKDIRIASLVLDGKGFSLRAEGSLKERITFLADIRELGSLAPGTKGILKTEGWLRFDKGSIAGSAAGRGSGISINDLHIENVSFEGEFSNGAGHPLLLRTDINGFAYNTVFLKQLRATAEGSIRDHDVTLDAKANAATELHMRLDGSYADGTWKGNLLLLSGRDAVGPFALKSPVRIRLSSREIFFSPVYLEGLPGENIELAGEMSQKPLDGFLEASWAQLNLSRFNWWLADVQLTGISNGNAEAVWRKDRIKKIGATASSSGRFSTADGSLLINEGALELLWDENGLKSSFLLRMAEGGVMEGQMNSPSTPDAGFPASANLSAYWKSLNLALLEPWMPVDPKLSGFSTGEVEAKWRRREIWSITADAEVTGAFTTAGERMEIKESAAHLEWNRKGIWASALLVLRDGGKMSALFSGSAVPRFSLPEEGMISAELENFDVSFFGRWLPKDLVLKGIASANAEGRLLPGKRFDFSGRSILENGKVDYLSGSRRFDAVIHRAEANWTWKSDRLKGDLSLSFSKSGTVDVKFDLPVPARIPVSPRPGGILDAEVYAKVEELGIMASLFPGVMQETDGLLEAAVEINGTWANPQFAGSFHLANAGAYFPDAGIKIKNVSLQGSLDREKISVEAFRAESGPGHIGGKGAVHLEKWEVKRYEGILEGEKFEAVNLPHLRVTASPRLALHGVAGRLSVEGEMLLPELLLGESKTPEIIEPSEDVIVVDRSEEPRTEPMRSDIAVKLILGDRVLVKLEGIDARLKGDIQITARNLREIRGKGMVRVVEGSYRRYGIDLAIQRGRIGFGGGPVDNPFLDILALREIDDVKAGVTVTGTIQSPVVKLYSEPTMPDTDILSYVVLGRRLGESGQETAILMRAADVLLSKGESVVLQNQLQQTLRLDVIDIESGKGDIYGSLVTVGKYLTPRLFVSYGVSLFGRGDIFRIRYKLSKHFEVESQSGTESGADIIYKIEFK